MGKNRASAKAHLAWAVTFVIQTRTRLRRWGPEYGIDNDTLLPVLRFSRSRAGTRPARAAAYLVPRRTRDQIAGPRHRVCCQRVPARLRSSERTAGASSGRPDPDDAESPGVLRVPRSCRASDLPRTVPPLSQLARRIAVPPPNSPGCLKTKPAGRLPGRKYPWLPRWLRRGACKIASRVTSPTIATESASGNPQDRR